MVQPSQDRIGVFLNGSESHQFERPWSYDTDWPRKFERISSVVALEYEEKKNKNRVGKRRDGENAWLMRVAYDLLLPMLEDGQLDLLILHCERHGRYAARGRPEDLNPFQIGLMAIFARWPKSISPQTRERLGKRLWHAARHYVPLEFLTGFIKQLDSVGFERRAAANDIEPGFEAWILREQSRDESDFDRGPLSFDQFRYGSGGR